MGLTVTTSSGAHDNAGQLDWIFDPQTTDGEKAGLSWSASAMGVCDALLAAGLIKDDEPVSGSVWSLDLAKALVTGRLSDPDIAEDDYLLPRLSRLQDLIVKGEARGATYLVVD